MEVVTEETSTQGQVSISISSMEVLPTTTPITATLFISEATTTGKLPYVISDIVSIDPLEIDAVTSQNGQKNLLTVFHVL